MAKIEKVNTNSNCSNKTAPGKMSPSHAKRWNLTVSQNAGCMDASEYKPFRHDHARAVRIKQMTETMVTYRMLSKVCMTETSLPSPMRKAIQYFNIPMGGKYGEVQASAPAATQTL